MGKKVGKNAAHNGNALQRFFFLLLGQFCMRSLHAKCIISLRLSRSVEGNNEKIHQKNAQQAEQSEAPLIVGFVVGRESSRTFAEKKLSKRYQPRREIRLSFKPPPIMSPLSWVEARKEEILAELSKSLSPRAPAFLAFYFSLMVKNCKAERESVHTYRPQSISEHFFSVLLAAFSFFCIPVLITSRGYRQKKAQKTRAKEEFEAD